MPAPPPAEVKGAARNSPPACGKGPGDGIRRRRADAHSASRSRTPLPQGGRRASILLGVIGRPHGVRGHVRLTSYTEPPEALAAYGPLSDERSRWFAVRWLGNGIAEIAEIVDGSPVRVADRTAAEKLTTLRLYVDRDRLPDPPTDEYYLADLVGLAARDATGEPIGTVLAVHDYGAGASLEVVRENATPLVVPFTRASVPVVDLAQGSVTLCPPKEIEALAEPEAAE